MKPKPCPVCLARLPSLGLLCGPCGRSFAIAMAKDGTTIAVIEWAAKRARRFAR